MFDLDAITSVAEIARHQAKVRPDGIALHFEGRDTTYSELNLHSSQVANGLIAEGCKPDSRIGFLGRNSDHYFEILFGSAKSKVAIVGVNWRLAAPEVQYVLENGEVEILFVTSAYFDLVASITDKLPRLRKVITMDGDYEDWPSYTEWRDGQSNEDPMLPIDPDDDVIQLYTSGTTGHPKGVQLTNDNYIGILEQAAQGGWADWEAGAACIVAMPVFHVAGVNVGVLGLAQGLKCVVLGDVDPTVILQLHQEHKIRYAFYVPAVIMFLNMMPNVRDMDHSCLESIVYGASPISEDVLHTAKEIFDCDFIQVYGLTETTGGGTVLEPEAHDPDRGLLRSCGKPGFGAEMKIIDDAGNELGPNQVGEILYRSRSLMKGYWRNPEATAKAIKDGWFYTGDAGYISEEGYVFIHDRVKDMIVSGGENIYPAEVENALASHPGVADVAVIGVPDDKWGEAVKACVVKAPDSDVTAEELIAHTRERIAGYKVPKSIDFLEALPRNPTGKLLKRELRAPYWEGRDRQVS